MHLFCHIGYSGSVEWVVAFVHWLLTFGRELKATQASNADFQCCPRQTAIVPPWPERDTPQNNNKNQKQNLWGQIWVSPKLQKLVQRQLSSRWNLCARTISHALHIASHKLLQCWTRTHARMQTQHTHIHARTHSHIHACTHTRTHARTHTRTHTRPLHRRNAMGVWEGGGGGWVGALGNGKRKKTEFVS